jgi:hypothetical protein
MEHKIGQLVFGHSSRRAFGRLRESRGRPLFLTMHPIPRGRTWHSRGASVAPAEGQLTEAVLKHARVVPNRRP